MVDHVEFVSHTINFPPFKTNFISAAPKQGGSVAPALISQVYSSKYFIFFKRPTDFFQFIVDSNTVENSGANQSFLESLGQDFAPADLTTFQQSFNVPRQAVAHVIGPNDPTQVSNIFLNNFF